MNLNNKSFLTFCCCLTLTIIYVFFVANTMDIIAIVFLSGLCVCDIISLASFLLEKRKQRKQQIEQRTDDKSDGEQDT